MVKNVKVSAPVQTYSEWSVLLEIAFPTLKSDHDEGSTYAVRKVGWLLADREDCRGFEPPPGTMAAGKITLPTAIVEFDGKPQLCRLPVELGSWAFDLVALAHAGNNLFPAKVEFGILDGQHYAEIL